MRLAEITVTAPCPECRTEAVLRGLDDSDVLVVLEGICPICRYAFTARFHRPDPWAFAAVISGRTAWGWARTRRCDDGTFAFEPSTGDGFPLAWTLD